MRIMHGMSSTVDYAQLTEFDINVLLQRSCRRGLTVVNMKKNIHPKFYEEAKVGPASKNSIFSH